MDRALTTIPLTALLPLLVGACGFNPKKEDCDGLDPRDGAELAAEDMQMEDGLADTGGFEAFYSSDTQRMIVTDDEAWQAVTSTWVIGAPRAVDFSTHAVFVHPWNDGGCSDGFQYWAFQWGDTIRMRNHEDSEGCKSANPKIDFVLVETGGSTDLGWCE